MSTQPKKEDLIIESEKIEPIEADSWEDNLTSDICNLSTALNNLSEIDSALLSKGRQSKLARMKRVIFDAMAYYCDFLPEMLKDDVED